MVRKSIILAQNFLRDLKLVHNLVSASSISAADIVYEIGPGEGIITRELATVAGKVVAIEKDAGLATRLQHEFRDSSNVEIRQTDFLRYEIRDSNYKVLSNLPFNITAQIVRKLVSANNPPQDSYLIMQKEAADKFAGSPRETEFSVLTKPWFEVSIVRNFRRTDFVPVPAVDVVLLNIRKRANPLIAPIDTGNYRRFVRHGFEAWKKDLAHGYKQIFTYEQWKGMSKELGFPLKTTPTQLTFEQWLGLFERFQILVPPSKRIPFLKS